MSKQSVLVPVETLERLIEAFDYENKPLCMCFAGCEKCNPDNAPDMDEPINELRSILRNTLRPKEVKS